MVASKGAGVNAPIHQQAATCHIAGMARAQKCTGIAKFGYGSRALGRNLLQCGLFHVLNGFSGFFGGVLEGGREAIRVHLARKQEIDGDVPVGHRSGDTCQKGSAYRRMTM